MSFLGSLLGARNRARPPDAPSAAAIARWQALAPADLRAPLSTQNWLVVDVETTGLDTRRDHLLAIGAVLINGTSICLEHSFEVVLKQATASRTDNILIHRIGGSEQIDGVDAAVALTALLGCVQKLPCAAFHAPFDKAMLKRAFDEHLGIDFSPPFIDLALLSPALCGDAPTGMRSLDEWVGHFHIAIGARHRAVADALGTAQLFQVLLKRAAAQKIETAEALFKIAEDQRWLSNARRT